MTFLEHRSAATLCKNPALASEGLGSAHLDAVLSAAGDEESDLSLLEDAHGREFAACMRVAIYVIATHQMGWRAPCGCFVTYWYRKPGEQR